MLIALFADIHDHTDNLLTALYRAEELGCTHLLFAGDMAGITTFRTMREEWRGGIDLVFGNNEYDRCSFLRLAEQFHHTCHHGDAGDLQLNGRRIYLSHYPAAAAQAVSSGLYDAVFYGHTHAAMKQHCGKTLLANPGEIAGVRHPPGFAVYDTHTNSLTHHTLA